MSGAFILLLFNAAHEFICRNYIFKQPGFEFVPHTEAPPRVNSAQPQDTSPEPYSSGVETAGEERFEVDEEWRWVNGVVPDDGTEWVDEDEDEKDDLLDFEYHRNYANNIEKRRRRWDTRWEALQQAVRCLPVKSHVWMLTFAVVLS
jgi:hypothetical protein